MKEKIWQVPTVVFLLLHIQDVNCFLHLVPLGYAGAGIAGIYGGYSYLHCKVTECCNNDYVSTNALVLDDLLQNELFGQNLAHETVVHAIQGHLSNIKPVKPLAMSFHGMQGTGKNYVAKLIAKALFKKGEDSKYYHFFNGRDDFPHESLVEKYKEDLQSTIINHIKKCETSLFVFDEVDKMPQGVLNALVPILDYTTYFRFAGVNKNKSIFIFLSNTGSLQIMNRLLELWESGRKREDTSLQDFESLITIGAFNEKGGFYKSDAIETSLIDHYVPFLPLEESHVIKCIKHFFMERSIVPSKESIEEVLAHVTFDPPPHNLYSRGGCKRLEGKVSIITNRRQEHRSL